MENASKALIIAGAILLSILIIGLGIFIFGQARSAMNNVNLNEQELQAFNSKFEQYIGTNISGSNAMALCDLVRTHNNSNSQDPSKQVNIKNNTASNTSSPTAAVNVNNITNVKKDLRAGYTYTVTVSYDAKTGCVCEVGIKKN